MFDFITDEDKFAVFAGGIVTGLLGLHFIKTKKARELAVKTVAQGFIVKDAVMEEVSNIREEAEDICAEAKARAKGECDCGCGCGSDCDCAE